MGKYLSFRYEKDRGRGKERDVYRETGIKKHVMIDGNRKTDRDAQKKKQRMWSFVNTTPSSKHL